MAAGLRVRRDRMDVFAERFNAACAERLSGADLRPVQEVDVWLSSLDDADHRLVGLIDELRPFGNGNATPCWGIRNARIVGTPRVVGKNHLRFTATGGGSRLNAIAFGMAERELPEGPADILFSLERDTYRGRNDLQMKVRDFAASP